MKRSSTSARQKILLQKEERNDIIRSVGLTTEWDTAQLAEITDTMTPKEAFVKCLREDSLFTEAQKSQLIQRFPDAPIDFLTRKLIAVHNLRAPKRHRVHLPAILQPYTYRHYNKVWKDELKTIYERITWDYDEQRPTGIMVRRDTSLVGEYRPKSPIIIPTSLAVYATLVDANLSVVHTELREHHSNYKRTVFPLSFPKYEDLFKAIHKIKVVNNSAEITDAYLVPRRLLNESGLSMEVTIYKYENEITNFLSRFPVFSVQ